MTAAHCGNQGTVYAEIGRYDQLTTTQYDRIQVETELPHPNYVDGISIRYDQLLMKLSSASTIGTIVQLNFDPNVPVDGQEVTVMGWGLTDPDESSTSPILLEAQLQIVSNEECAASMDPYSNYEELVYDDMVCAYGAGADSCQGDSGGPMIMETSTGDLQVGVVSWGFGCAGDSPGVYSRPSYDPAWLIATVCQYSNDPPDYFNCGSNTYTPAPVPAPTPSPTSSPWDGGYLDATIEIFMDGYPRDIGWQLEYIGDPGDPREVVALRSPGVYTTPYDSVQEAVTLKDGAVYSFFIIDTSSNGLCCTYGTGSYRLTIGDRVVITGNGEFDYGKDHTFLASAEDFPAPTPVTAGDFFLELEIVFDANPEEVGWILRTEDSNSDSLNGPVIAYMPSGSYTSALAYQQITETIFIPSPGNYAFLFLDDSGDGICCDYGAGSFTLYLGPDEDQKVVAQSVNEPSTRQIFTFTIVLTSGGTAAPSASLNPGSEPAGSPVTAGETTTVYISIQPDSKPGDIGWRIEGQDGRIMASKSAESYTSSNYIREQLELEASDYYTLVMTDVSGDGLCCDYGQGYFLLQTSNGIAAFGREYGSSQSVVFAATGDFPVSLKLQMDDSPTETSWFFERLDLEVTASIALAPFGYYNTTTTTVEQSFLVPDGGFYRLTILDSNDNGICCDAGQGSISLTAGNDQKVVASVAGEFTSSTAFHFLASNDLPTISNPRTLTLSLDFDQYPFEVSWLLLQGDDDSEVSSEARATQNTKQQIVAFGPRESSSYSQAYASKTWDETIEVEAIPDGVTRSFTFVMLDSSGDGLCCDWGNGKYTLYDGSSSTVESKIVLSGKAQGTAREAQSFTLTASSFGGASMGGGSSGGSSDAVTLSAWLSASATMVVLVTAAIL